jgi:hypothetical protein
MAVCWRLPPSRFDEESAWSPERYSPERGQQQELAENSIPLAKLVSFRKETFNPIGNRVERPTDFIVLDTNHAYEGRVQFRGKPVPAEGVGSIKRPLKPGYVIVSRLRTYLRQVALIDNDLLNGFEGALLCSTEFYVLAPTDDADIAFLVPFLLSRPVQKAFAAAEEGGHHPRIPPDVLLKLAVPLSIIRERDDISRRVRQSVQLVRQGEKVMFDLNADTAKLTALISATESEPFAATDSRPRARRTRAAA